MFSTAVCQHVFSYFGTSGNHLFLSRFKNVTVMKEEWLHLIDTPWSHEDEVEDGE